MSKINHHSLLGLAVSPPFRRRPLLELLPNPRRWKPLGALSRRLHSPHLEFLIAIVLTTAGEELRCCRPQRHSLSKAVEDVISDPKSSLDRFFFFYSLFTFSKIEFCSFIYSLVMVSGFGLMSMQRLRADVRMDAAVGGEEEETRQAKEMAAARRRWESLIREQKVKVLTPREAGYAIQLSSKALLDVRPSTEHEKAWVRGSTWIPIFDVDKGSDVGALSRKITNFVMGGWWSGSPMLAYDKDFVKKVEEKFPKDTDIIVVCQKGLRSLAACEQLYNAGFQNLFWVQGGLEASEEEDFAREGPQPFKFAGIGGVSEFLGWTDQQRIIASKEGWSYRLIFTGRLLGLILLADALLIGAQKLGPLLQDLRSHG